VVCGYIHRFEDCNTAADEDIAVQRMLLAAYGRRTAQLAMPAASFVVCHVDS
jgi:hypothetical protein